MLFERPIVSSALKRFSQATVKADHDGFLSLFHQPPGMYFECENGRSSILRGLATNGGATDYQATLRSLDGEAKALRPLHLTVS